jgi:hypothetical protein
VVLGSFADVCVADVGTSVAFYSSLLNLDVIVDIVTAQFNSRWRSFTSAHARLRIVLYRINEIGPLGVVERANARHDGLQLRCIDVAVCLYCTGVDHDVDAHGRRSPRMTASSSQAMPIESTRTVFPFGSAHSV